MTDDPTLWAIFFAVVITAFVLDVGVLNRGKKRISVKKALALTAMWITLALSFGLLIYFEKGSGAATEYVTAFMIEEMLSADNLFVFIVIFGYFCVPSEYQHKALFYGIIGAFAFRAVFIFAGVELLDRFDWMMYIFGAILIYTAIKTVWKKDENKDNKLAKRMSRRFKVCPDYDNDRLFTAKNGVRMMTPLFLCIVVIELTDIMFAFDSIPAALAITKDPFIVYTSNIFAVVGLRSLFFVIKGSMESMEYLKYGLGVILAFVGIKMILTDHFHVDVVISLAVILIVLAVTVTVSLYVRKKKEKAAGT